MKGAFWTFKECEALIFSIVLGLMSLHTGRIQFDVLISCHAMLFWLWFWLIKNTSKVLILNKLNVINVCNLYVKIICFKNIFATKLSIFNYQNVYYLEVRRFVTGNVILTNLNFDIIVNVVSLFSMINWHLGVLQLICFELCNATQYHCNFKWP